MEQIPIRLEVHQGDQIDRHDLAMSANSWMCSYPMKGLIIGYCIRFFEQKYPLVERDEKGLFRVKIQVERRDDGVVLVIFEVQP